MTVGEQSDNTFFTIEVVCSIKFRMVDNSKFDIMVIGNCVLVFSAKSAQIGQILEDSQLTYDDCCQVAGSVR